MTDILKDKTVLISGGTTGIGRATAKLLVQAGAKVMIFGRNKAHLDDAVSEIKKFGQIVGIEGDVSSDADVKRIFAEFEKMYGKIDILVNNASLPARSIYRSSFKHRLYVLSVNILGYMNCTNEALKQMKARKDGHIVNIGSMSAKVKEEGDDLYVATKSAVEGFTESLRKKINRWGIRVSLIEPGTVGTGMVHETTAEQEKMQEEFLMLKAEDIAEAVIFCLTRPKRCDVICLEIKPHKQTI